MLAASHFHNSFAEADMSQGRPTEQRWSRGVGSLMKFSSEFHVMPKLLIIAALAAGLALSACNTVAGAGKDAKSAGEAVTKTANDAK